MKRYLFLVLFTLTTCITFGNTIFNLNHSNVPAWDEPLFRTRVTTPTIASVRLYVTHQSGDDNLTIDLMFEQPGAQDGHVWRATIATQVYGYFMTYGQGLPHREYQWATMLYTVDVDANQIHKITNYTLYNDGQLITYNGLGGDGFVNDNQYYVSSLEQL